MEGGSYHRKMGRMLMQCEESEVYARRDVSSEIVAIGSDEVVGDGSACIDDEDWTMLIRAVNTFVVSTDGSCKTVGTEGLGCRVIIADRNGGCGIETDDLRCAEAFNLVHHLGCHIDGR